MKVKKKQAFSPSLSKRHTLKHKQITKGLRVRDQRLSATESGVENTEDATAGHHRSFSPQITQVILENLKKMAIQLKSVTEMLEETIMVCTGHKNVGTDPLSESETEPDPAADLPISSQNKSSLQNGYSARRKNQSESTGIRNEPQEEFQHELETRSGDGIVSKEAHECAISDESGFSKDKSVINNEALNDICTPCRIVLNPLFDSEISQSSENKNNGTPRAQLSRRKPSSRSEDSSVRATRPRKPFTYSVDWTSSSESDLSDAFVSSKPKHRGRRKNTVDQEKSPPPTPGTSGVNLVKDTNDGTDGSVFSKLSRKKSVSSSARREIPAKDHDDSDTWKPYGTNGISHRARKLSDSSNDDNTSSNNSYKHTASNVQAATRHSPRKVPAKHLSNYVISSDDDNTSSDEDSHKHTSSNAQAVSRPSLRKGSEKPLSSRSERISTRSAEGGGPSKSSPLSAIPTVVLESDDDGEELISMETAHTRKKTKSNNDYAISGDKDNISSDDDNFKRTNSNVQAAARHSPRKRPEKPLSTKSKRTSARILNAGAESDDFEEQISLETVQPQKKKINSPGGSADDNLDVASAPSTSKDQDKSQVSATRSSAGKKTAKDTYYVDLENDGTPEEAGTPPSEMQDAEKRAQDTPPKKPDSTPSTPESMKSTPRKRKALRFLDEESDDGNGETNTAQSATEIQEKDANNSQVQDTPGQDNLSSAEEMKTNKNPVGRPRGGKKTSPVIVKSSDKSAERKTNKNPVGRPRGGKKTSHVIPKSSDKSAGSDVLDKSENGTILGTKGVLRSKRKKV